MTVAEHLELSLTEEFVWSQCLRDKDMAGMARCGGRSLHHVPIMVS